MRAASPGGMFTARPMRMRSYGVSVMSVSWQHSFQHDTPLWQSKQNEFEAVRRTGTTGPSAALAQGRDDRHVEVDFGLPAARLVVRHDFVVAHRSL